MHDAIVVGMGPAGAATATMLREPAAFKIAGSALDVLALEGRSINPTRMRVVALQEPAFPSIEQLDALLGRTFTDPVAPEHVSTLAGLERAWRQGAAKAGVDVRYDQRVASVLDHGEDGVLVAMQDGTEHRGRFLVDATGARLGPFVHGEPTGHSVYLTGNLPAASAGGPMLYGRNVQVEAADGARQLSQVFAFNDRRSVATAYVQYPGLPSGPTDAAAAHRLLASQLERGGLSPAGLHDAQFIQVPLVRTPDAVDGSMIAVGDTVRRLSPEGAYGVTNALVDARGAAWAIQESVTGAVPREQALAGYAKAASRR